MLGADHLMSMLGGGGGGKEAKTKCLHSAKFSEMYRKTEGNRQAWYSQEETAELTASQDF